MRFPLSSLMLAAIVALILSATAAFAQGRMASDFEIAEMERQAANARDFPSLLSAHLNLGDLRTTRNETSLGREEYRRALALAEQERSAARSAGNLARYANATAYAALAQAKLGNTATAFDGLEEALRYASDSSRIWNLDATAMSLAGHGRKAVAAARNAVVIASEEARRSPSLSSSLDFGVYRFALASALLASHGDDHAASVDGPGAGAGAARSGAGGEAKQLLLEVIASLQEDEYEGLRKEAAQREQFQIYSSTRGHIATYLSLLNRTRLRLGHLYEEEGDLVRAREQFQAVVRGRTDDPVALAGLARVSREREQRDRYFIDAFDANPFSLDLIDAYVQFLRDGRFAVAESDTAGGRVRLALQQLSRDDGRSALAALQPLITGDGENDVLQYLAARADIAAGNAASARRRQSAIQLAELRRRIDDAVSQSASDTPAFLQHGSGEVRDASPADLRRLMQLLEGDQLTGEQRTRLDRLIFSSAVGFDATAHGDAPGSATTVLASGNIGEVAIRFAEPTAFRGVFEPSQRLRLTYRILGAARADDGLALLIEPVRLEADR